MTTDVPLPKPYTYEPGTLYTFPHTVTAPIGGQPLHTADQMRAYGDARAAAAVQAERERAVREVMPRVDEFGRAMYHTGSDPVSAERKAECLSKFATVGRALRGETT
jgi:hypothetical protein